MNEARNLISLLTFLHLQYQPSRIRDLRARQHLYCFLFTAQSRIVSKREPVYRIQQHNMCCIHCNRCLITHRAFPPVSSALAQECVQLPSIWLYRYVNGYVHVHVRNTYTSILFVFLSKEEPPPLFSPIASSYLPCIDPQAGPGGGSEPRDSSSILRSPQVYK